MLVSTLSVGAAGGYFVAEKRLVPALDTWLGRPPPTPPATPEPAPTADAAPPAPTAAPVASAPAPPPCDDGAGTVGDCPPPGFPTIEGGCGSFAHTRCNEFKQTMKPKVAAAAVGCLAKLTARERCDPARVYLCGHLALVNSCLEVESVDAGVTADAGTGTGTGPDGGVKSARSANSVCQEIVASCGTSPIAPAMAECQQLLSGMTDVGRERTRACMKGHCFDRGLVGCEGVGAAK